MTSRILLVDDEVRILDVMTNMLMELGWDVKATSLPDEALKLVAEEKFHMAFVDNFLGPVEGTELVGKLGKIDPDLQFVIMTGNPNIETAIHALKTGVADFLRKPFRMEELLVSIDHVNRRLELEQQRKDLLAGLELTVQEKTEELRQTYLSVLVTLSRTVEKKDLGTYGHSMRVSEMSARIAENIGLSTAEIADIRAASLLHDIGKIGISDYILAKKGPLTDEETGIIHTHPQKGVEILQPLKQFESLLPAILHHHERYDGSGYPAGLSGDAIPISARIISVADTFDAVISERPYRGAGTDENAMAELRAFIGRQFDPKVVGTFFEVMRNGVEIGGRGVCFAEDGRTSTKELMTANNSVSMEQIL
jgi:putative two-component system response regulator